MKKLLAASAFILAFSPILVVSPAKADQITFTATLDGVNQGGASSSTGELNFGPQLLIPSGVFRVTVTAQSQTALAAGGIINTNTLDVNQVAGGNHQLILDIVATGLTGPGALTSLLSTFSVSSLTSGWNAQEQTFINGVLLSDTGQFTTSSGSVSLNGVANVTNPFSAAVRYTINSVGDGQFNGGIAVAVPGPIVGAGLPGLLAGGLMLLGALRRRRHVTA